MSKKRKFKKKKKQQKKVSMKHPRQNIPKLSLCMIVKNEEKLLPGCLESAKDFVDEIIIVDTGSTDKTIEIAKQYNAKIYEHPWENNFSKHRNQSISYATSDWILYLDADEELIPPSGEIVRKAIQDNTIDSIAVQIINPFNNGKNMAVFNSVRVFKNHIRFEGIVHNMEVGCRSTKFYPIRILHQGYNLNEQKMKAKFERTTSLLKAQISEDPDNPLPHHYLSASYLSMGAFDHKYYNKAIEESAIAIRLATEKQENDEIYLSTHYIAAACHLNLGRTNDAETICKAALRIFPEHLDSLYLLCKLYYRVRDYNQAKICAESYLAVRNKIEKRPERFGKLINNSFWGEWLINIIRAKVAYEQGSYDQARDIFKSVSKKAIGNWEAHKLIGEFYFKKAVYNEAICYLQEACKIKKDKVLLYMLVECCGQVGDIEKQIKTLSDIIEVFPEEIDNLRQIGLVQFKRANYRLASFCLGKVAEQRKKGSAGERPTISTCLMVKNEEHCLENCLKSIKGFVDEIIVVDTGSTDRTIEIAERYGAKVFHHPWEGDFSKHRNQSMSYATCDWILQIDADETLDRESAEFMTEIAQKTSKNAVFFKIWNCTSKGEPRSLFAFPRLFRNGVGCHYTGIVHNQPHYPGEPESSSLTIYHYGYDLTPDQMKAKGKRTTELLEKQIKMNPEDPFSRFNLAISKYITGDFSASVNEGEKAIQLIQKYGITDPGYAGIYYIVGAAYYSQGRLDQAKEIALQGLTYSPDNLDVLCVLTAIYEQEQEYSKAIESGERYLALHEKISYSEATHNADYKTLENRWMVLLTLSFACHKANQQENARKRLYEAYDCASLEAFPLKERARSCIRIGESCMERGH
jgi:glycosyltransferase involved in cell wall biosynthesis